MKQIACLGLVLGNGCNIDCIHCYQAKNGDNLLRPQEIGFALRREFGALYPYLSTLRIQGGEVFAYAGFRDLLDDVACAVERPIVSISTNGTLIDEAWAERVVRLPMQNITFSIDAAQEDTFAMLRRGGSLPQILANVERVQNWKSSLNSAMPHLDAFFVVMRSNFRQIPRFFDLMADIGMIAVALQTMELGPHNQSRTPALGGMESITSQEEAEELHGILKQELPRNAGRFVHILVSGMQTLFERHGLDCAFMNERQQSLYPDTDAHDGLLDLCPNPWTTLFVVENGDAHLCFLSEAVGNLYETPLEHIWNGPRAIAKRSMMQNGQYTASGCSPHFCGWRDGKKTQAPLDLVQLRGELQTLRKSAEAARAVSSSEAPSSILSVRRTLKEKVRRIDELGALVQQICETNQNIHDRGMEEIERLRSQLNRPLVKAAGRLSRLFKA